MITLITSHFSCTDPSCIVCMPSAFHLLKQGCAAAAVAAAAAAAVADLWLNVSERCIRGLA